MDTNVLFKDKMEVSQMEKIPQGRYTRGFREETARLVLEAGMSVGEVAARLSLPKSTVENWVRAAKAGRLGDIAMAPRMTKHLVSQSFFRAVAAKRPAAGLLHHSDRGSQYCAHAFRKLLRPFRMQASMSRKGNCYDNASMDSFWSKLKTEHVFHRQDETRRQAMREIAEYIELFSNRQRRQQQLGSLPPAAFERRHYEQRLAA